jgi:hypothetical protein
MSNEISKKHECCWLFQSFCLPIWTSKSIFLCNKIVPHYLAENSEKIYTHKKMPIYIYLYVVLYKDQGRADTLPFANGSFTPKRNVKQLLWGAKIGMAGACWSLHASSYDVYITYWLAKYCSFHRPRRPSSQAASEKAPKELVAEDSLEV